MYVNVQHKNVNLLTKKSQCLTGIERFFGINNCKTPESGLTDSSFADFNLYCKDEGSTYHCYSPFLSCLASRGTNDEGKNGTKISSCRTIFGNTLNNYKDTFTELKRNRENLISKMDRLNS